MVQFDELAGDGLKGGGKELSPRSTKPPQKRRRMSTTAVPDHNLTSSSNITQLPPLVGLEKNVKHSPGTAKENNSNNSNNHKNSDASNNVDNINQRTSQKGEAMPKQTRGRRHSASGLCGINIKSAMFDDDKMQRLESPRSELMLGLSKGRERASKLKQLLGGVDVVNKEAKVSFALGNSISLPNLNTGSVTRLPSKDQKKLNNAPLKDFFLPHGGPKYINFSVGGFLTKGTGKTSLLASGASEQPKASKFMRDYNAAKALESSKKNGKVTGSLQDQLMETRKHVLGLSMRDASVIIKIRNAYDRARTAANTHVCSLIFVECPLWQQWWPKSVPKTALELPDAFNRQYDPTPAGTPKPFTTGNEGKKKLFALVQRYSFSAAQFQFLGEGIHIDHGEVSRRSFARMCINLLQAPRTDQGEIESPSWDHLLSLMQLFDKNARKVPALGASR